MLPAEVSQPRWSADSRYVAVEYQINDDASAVHIADVGHTPPVLIDAGRGHSAKWSRSGHKLFIVPDFGVTELPTTAGMIVFDPALRTSDRVAKEYYFFGRYDVGASNVIAQAIEYVEGRPTYSLIAYDLTNGSVEVIARADQ